MLPAGLVAQPADRVDHHRLRALHPAARSVLRLTVGACSCDLVRERHADRREDERHLRDRWRRAGGPRDSLLTVIERHRQGAGVPAPAGGWPRALAAFVAEHARNAGDTLYVLRFGAAHLPAAATDGPTRRLHAALVVARPHGWLDEHAPVLVGR